jgi:glycosyltransferase involved in cell wall biosynthesis
MRQLIAQMVIKDEAGRFLDHSLEWHGGIFDAIHVYDDGSTDDSVEIALDHGCYVTKRPFTVPSFLKHEGKFRQAAWRAMEEKIQPTLDDWVFAIDADEFVVSHRDESAQLNAICRDAEQGGARAVLIHIPEVFDTEVVEDGADTVLVKPRVRVDGFWGRIAGTRLFRYQPFGVMADKTMASGSEPTYVTGAPRIDARDLWLMHYGYADPADRKAKYERYTGAQHFHSDAHVRSIAEPPDLVAWDGPSVDVRRGRRTENERKETGDG